MTETEVQQQISNAILAHERRVGFISGVIGAFWLCGNIGVIIWLIAEVKKCH